MKLSARRSKAPSARHPDAGPSQAMRDRVAPPLRSFSPAFGKTRQEIADDAISRNFLANPPQFAKAVMDKFGGRPYVEAVRLPRRSLFFRLSSHPREPHHSPSSHADPDPLAPLSLSYPP